MAEETDLEPGGDRTLAATTTTTASAPRVQFSDEQIPPAVPPVDPFQDHRLNKSDIEKVIEKRIVGGGGGATSDHTDLMILYTARGRCD